MGMGSRREVLQGMIAGSALAATGCVVGLEPGYSRDDLEAWLLDYVDRVSWRGMVAELGPTLEVGETHDETQVSIVFGWSPVGAARRARAIGIPVGTTAAEVEQIVVDVVVDAWLDELAAGYLVDGRSAL